MAVASVERSRLLQQNIGLLIALFLTSLHITNTLMDQRRVTKCPPFITLHLLPLLYYSYNSLHISLFLKLSLCITIIDVSLIGCSLSALFLNASQLPFIATPRSSRVFLLISFTCTYSLTLYQSVDLNHTQVACCRNMGE